MIAFFTKDNTVKNKKIRPLNIAIASHGLGLVTRGTEMWAKNLSYALKEKGIDVTLYKAWGRTESEIEHILPCTKRDSKIANRLSSILPSFCWRIGFNTPHSIEATTFALSLIKAIIFKKFDIIHTADPQVARVLASAKRIGMIKSKIIFANAIPDEPVDFIEKVGFVQQRTPYYIEEGRRQGLNITNWFGIPNFVDIEKFKPQDKAQAKERLGIANDTFVVLCVATIDSSYKRIDYLIREMADFYSIRKEKVLLLIAGAERKESKELIQMAKDMLGDRVKILLNLSHERMPEIYNAADIFVLCSVNEVFGIAFIEAMACGIPAIGHIYPPTKWIIGSGGDCVDMLEKGVLSQTLSIYNGNIDYRIDKGKKAKEEVAKRFSEDSVVRQIIDMYKKIADN